MRMESEKELMNFLAQGEKKLEDEKKKALKEEIQRQKLLYNKIYKHIPVLGKQYLESIGKRALINIEGKF